MRPRDGDRPGSDLLDANETNWVFVAADRVGNLNY